MVLNCSHDYCNGRAHGVTISAYNRAVKTIAASTVAIIMAATVVNIFLVDFAKT